MGIRPWILLSSSSGETFRALWPQLSEAAQNSFLGYFADRPSPGVAVATSLLGAEQVFEYAKPQFETALLKKRESMPDDLVVVLCGYKAILSASFLEALRAPVINLHPSLLPAFPGLDHKVHEMAFAQVTVSGFSLHLVDDSMDGGPVLYQHPVYWGHASHWEAGRDLVRAAEQKYFPPLLDDILRSSLTANDRLRTSRDLQPKVQWSKLTFSSQEILSPPQR